MKQVQVQVKTKRSGKTHYERIAANPQADLDKRSPSGKVTYKN